MSEEIDSVGVAALQAADAEPDGDDAVGEINEVRIWLARNGFVVDRSRPLVLDVHAAVHASKGRSAFRVGDLVRWTGDTGWFEGRIVKPTNSRAVMWMEKWDVEVTDGGTFYTPDRPGPSDGIVHVNEESLTLISREGPAHPPTSEASPE